jgi:hypothetical protein
MDGPHLRTLREALKVVSGSKERLAVALAMPLGDLEACLAGQKALPHQGFLDALDIVARNATKR